MNLPFILISVVGVPFSTGISSASIANLGRGDNITTDILLRICVALNCNLQDILEIVYD
ncbi:helix-turn-helix domain-containing protein [Streptococcus macedonicus]|nr:helix-turn-helix domain-containing protein [Streptococcus macedonicus]PHV60899.1 hypothetical protein CS005_00725 [Streptococcus macedonicus]